MCKFEVSMITLPHVKPKLSQLSQNPKVDNVMLIGQIKIQHGVFCYKWIKVGEISPSNDRRQLSTFVKRFLRQFQTMT